MAETILDIRDLCIDFRQGKSLTRAVDGISFRLEKGQTLGIVGESGSGKSVTALSIMQLIPSPPGHISKGQILYHDGNITTDLLQLREKDMRIYRGNRIGMIFQEPMTSLNPVYTCGKQVEEVIRLHQKKSRKQAKEIVLEWFREVNLPRPEQVYRSYPHQLSGGQKQRVMIAMAMCCQPSVLIADEPTTALDVTIQKTILELIRELQQKFGMSVIFITHDLGVVSEIADRVVVMYRGKIVEEGTMNDIFTKAQHPYTLGLLACRPALHAGKKRLPTVEDYLNAKQGIPHAEESVLKSHYETTKTKPILKVDKLRLWYPEKRSWLGRVLKVVKAVDEVSFEVWPGETLGLVGESGCGKTSLGRALLRLISADSGSIVFEEKDLMRLSKGSMRKIRKDFQIIFQDPYSSLSPRMTIGTALTEPLKVHHIGKNRAARREIVIHMLKKVGLDESHYYRYPHEFSGGQRQRVCIARALVLQPKFIICDESVSALDVSVQAQVLNLLNQLKDEFGFTYIFISHDLSVVRFMSDRIMVMKEGRIVESGAAADIYENPRHPYTRSLIEAIPGSNG